MPYQIKYFKFIPIMLSFFSFFLLLHLIVMLAIVHLLPFLLIFFNTHHVLILKVLMLFLNPLNSNFQFKPFFIYVFLLIIILPKTFTQTPNLNFIIMVIIKNFVLINWLQMPFHL